MNKYEIVKRIEKFAPPEFAEPWDCSGWLVETPKTQVKKVMLALTVTDNVVEQALKENCDMIISHHPLFNIPTKYKDIDIYCAHTNLDLTEGGTTDTLIERLNLHKTYNQGFLRFVETEIQTEDLTNKLKTISPHLRYVNNKNIKTLQKIAFCAGSGTEFIEEAFEQGADALVTGDLKFHTALESPIIVYDIGHFESEIQVLEVFKNLIKNDIEVIFSTEGSPFRY